MEESQVKAYHENERLEMHEILNVYIRKCVRAGATAEKICKETDSIEKGIVELIYDHGIKWLVMGAAADKYYSRKMEDLKSKKAIFVRTEAPRFCHIWFVCKGNLIYTRQSRYMTVFDPEYIRESSRKEAYEELVRRKQAEKDVIDALRRKETMNDELCGRLRQFVQFVDEAQSSRKEAYEESVRRKKAEKDVIDAIPRAKTSETMYTEERRRRIENKEALARGKEVAEKMKWQLDEVIEEFRVAQEQKFSLECQIADTNKMVDELEQKMCSAVELLQKYKNKRDNLQFERDHALKVAEEPRKKQAEGASSSSVSQFYCEFSSLEIEVATDNFSEALKIGEGGYGSIYRGNLRHIEVAIKILHPNSSQGPSEFQQEVNILSKLRHPNIAALIGACPETWALVYEYLPNGSLEDRLNCKNNTPPLSWKARIRIAAELCSALIFMHSFSPLGMVHCDLKPSNILLNADFVSKLSDFGISRELPQDELTENNTTRCCRTEPKGTPEYMDPELRAKGELTSKSDVYSFGIILLRLLTGRPALGITKEVQDALDKGNLKDLLDPTAGDWPFVQAKQLARLALRCSDMSRSRRPDLASEVWSVLEPMKILCGVSYLQFGSEEHRQIPAYFVCPIVKEIMRDPVFAADGFTYESEAIKGWLEDGHDTSPMTNLKLPHCDLVPNHALRSAIQEWIQPMKHGHFLSPNVSCPTFTDNSVDTLPTLV